MIAVIGAVAWAIIAFARGETVNAVWFVVAAICTYIIGFRFYARLIEMKIVRPRDDHATPAEILDDGTDYVPTDRRVLFGHHFAAIAGAGPLVGPVLATQMGYLPCSIWIVIGAVFAGAVQDYLVLWISTRRRGRSLGQMARDELGATGGAAALVGAFVIMVIIIAVLALVVVRGLAQSPWGVFSIAMTIPIALFMGCYLRFLRPGRVAEVSLIGVALLLLAVACGNWVGQTSWGTSWLNLSPVTVSWLIIIYGFVASVLPVWLLLAPRDYLSTFMKVGAIALLAVGICVAQPVMQAPAISRFATTGRRTGVRRLAVPVPVHHHRVRRAIRISCADLIGDDAEAAGEGKPDAVDRLRRHAHRVVRRCHGADHRGDPRPAPVLHPQRPGRADRRHRGHRRGLRQRTRACRGLRPPRTSSVKPPPAWAKSRSCRAPAEHRRWRSACPRCCNRVFGGAGLRAFWYHFAIMFEALFILTAVDAGTRVARFMLSDTLGNLGGPLAKLRNPSWRPGVWVCSLAVAAAWGSILLMGVTDPLGGINTLFPLFGIANQLLAAVALTVITVVVIKKGLLKWAWIPGIPLLWDLTVTLTASWQKIFSADPAVGYWTQHFQYLAARNAGKTSFGSAKNPHQLDDVIRNTFIQGTLSILFAMVVVIVLIAGIVVALRVIRGGGRPLTEDHPVPSKLFAPSGSDPHRRRARVAKTMGRVAGVEHSIGGAGA